MKYADRYLTTDLSALILKDRTLRPHGFMADSYEGGSMLLVYKSSSRHAVRITPTIQSLLNPEDYMLIRLIDADTGRVFRRADVHTRGLLLGGPWSLWTGDSDRDIPTFWRALAPYLPAISNPEAWPHP